MIDVVEEIKLLGLIIRSDLKWSSNTNAMVAKAYKRLWILRRLKNLGASVADLLDVYCKQVRSILEFGAPVWHSGITQGENKDIERVQKAAFHIILGGRYFSYQDALCTLNMNSLVERRDSLDSSRDGE